MKTKEAIKNAVYHVLTRAIAERLGVTKEEAAPKSFGARISMLVMISGALLALGKTLLSMKSSLGMQWTTILDLSERHEALRAEFNALAGRSDDGTSEVQRLRAEVQRLRADVEASARMAAGLPPGNDKTTDPVS